MQGGKRMASEGGGWVGVAMVAFLMVAITSPRSRCAGLEDTYVKAEEKFAKEVPSESWAEWAKEKLTGSLDWKTEPHQDQEEAKDNIQNLAVSGAGDVKDTTKHAQKTEESSEEEKEKASRKMEEAKEKAYQKAREAKEKVQQTAAYNKDKEGGDPEDTDRSDKADQEVLSWVKEKAKEKYEAAKTKTEETLEPAKQKSKEMLNDDEEL
ncbi:Late embryogenesis abundant protein like [Actinidia chinensis var. chinensis]|uniref:Late embryogenesis abundant protein like n=1 Tax=Actinidia chinensis var. chinensis TaxID=1590841 RepID=A0A2R6PWJ5_ACTCC|nr:Late embryogenesis abundant protein like [Actinidia chinensis var. chinensis]